MKLIAKDLLGREYPIEGLEPTDTIDHIKYRMSEMHDLPEQCIERMRMIYYGKGLEDGRCISDYKMEDGKFIHIVYRTSSKNDPVQFVYNDQIICQTIPFVAKKFSNDELCQCQ